MSETTQGHFCLLMWSYDRYWIVGPFADYAASVTYGRAWQHANQDDPRWHTITLADPHAAPQVIDPATAPLATNSSDAAENAA